MCLCLTFPVVLCAAATGNPDAVGADGGRYYGKLQDGKFHGRGRIEWDNGARYEGEFANGLYSGNGRLRSGSGEIYDGEFRDGQMQGRGRMQLPDGSIYVGEFRSNYFDGSGRLVTPDGNVYEGTFKQGHFDGQGRLIRTREEYQGEFKRGQYWGLGEATYDDGVKYRGEFIRGRFHGNGRFENAQGEVYEGAFENHDFTGAGTYSRPDGARYEGSFLKWRPHGKGRYTDASGNVYEGRFVNGDLSGIGRLIGSDGGLYEGEFKQWLYDGQGTLQLANGDVYKGGFARGLYEGQGTLTYAAPRPDGRTEDSGVWRYGALADGKELLQAKLNVEIALYNQRQLLDKALASIAPRDPGKINLYLLAVAGDGSQEVFRREVEFVQEQFAVRFGTRGRSLALINSRNTVTAVPMATVTSIRDALQAVASRMDKEKDILFLFLTSHGSENHEFVLNQNSMNLRNLPARELGRLLKDSGVRWKVVVVLACYSGGFIDPIRDDHTLVITAARHDRQSFGCEDGNDFTYFGRAFFKEALPHSNSFQDAFRKARTLVRQWEIKELGADNASDSESFSLPQILSPKPIEKYLHRWWLQAAGERSKERAHRASNAGATLTNIIDSESAAAIQ